MVDEVALSQKYKYTEIESYANVPTNKGNPDREWSQLRPDLVAHATIEKNVERILDEGLKPRQASYCKVWGEERVPHRIREAKRADEILQCREEHVYFWDDAQEAIGQALGTVAYLKKGDPAIILVKQNQKELERDPEIESNSEDPVALMAKGEVEKNKIACFCTLSQEMKPDTGKLLCPTQYSEEQCELFGGGKPALDTLYEKISEPDQWVCFCKKDALK